MKGPDLRIGDNISKNQQKACPSEASHPQLGEKEREEDFELSCSLRRLSRSMEKSRAALTTTKPNL